MPSTSARLPLFGEAVTLSSLHSSGYTERFGNPGTMIPFLKDGPLRTHMRAQSASFTALQAAQENLRCNKNSLHVWYVVVISVVAVSTSIISAAHAHITTATNSRPHTHTDIHKRVVCGDRPAWISDSQHRLNSTIVLIMESEMIQVTIT